MDIYIPNGTIATHSFDLWGVVVDQEKLGNIRLDQFRDLAQDQGMDEAVRDEAIRKYQGLLNGEAWAIADKSNCIDGVEKLLKQAGFETPYNQAFLEDGLSAAHDILEAREGLIIFSSKMPEGLREQLPEDIGDRIGDFYEGDKREAADFARISEAEKKQGKTLVSHTADELHELLAARQFSSELGLIYVNRNNSNTRDAVLAQGIDLFVDDLRTVSYTGMVAGNHS